MNRKQQIRLICAILIASMISALSFPCRQLRADSDLQETDQSYQEQTNEEETIESTEGTEETLGTEMSESLVSSETVEQVDTSDTTAETTEIILESSASVEPITETTETTSLTEMQTVTLTENSTVTPALTSLSDNCEGYSVFSQGEGSIFGYTNSFVPSDWILSDGASITDDLIKLDNDILTGNARATYNGVRSFSPDYSLSGRFTFCAVSVNSYYELRNDLEFCIISPDEGLTGPSISIYFDPVYGTISLLCNRDRSNPIVTASCPELLDGYYNEIWYEYDGQTHVFNVYATENTLVEMVVKPEDPILSCEIDLSEVFDGSDSFTCMFELFDWLRSTVVISGLEIDPNPSLHKNSNYGVKSEDDSRNDSRNERENERRSGSGIPLADWTCYDEAGGKIARWYLFGMGKERIIIDDPFWTEYMESRSELLHQVQDAVFAEANGMEVGQVNKVVDITCHMELDNGEGVVGYNFLHGSEPTVGDFEISGTITRLENGDVKYNLTYTWNDIMDPNEIYPTDVFKNSILEQIRLCKYTMGIYVMRVTWSDESVIGNNSYGWLSNE